MTGHGRGLLAQVVRQVAESTEYQITTSITIDLTGAGIDTAEVTALADLLWTGFLTTPEIAPA